MASASAAGCNELFSEDLNTGEMVGGVRVINPFMPQGAVRPESEHPMRYVFHSCSRTHCLGYKPIWLEKRRLNHAGQGVGGVDAAVGVVLLAAAVDGDAGNWFIEL